MSADTKSDHENDSNVGGVQKIAEHSADEADHPAGDHKHDDGHKHSSSHPHSHGDARKLSRKRLLAVLALTGSFMIAEAIAGFITGSLSLIADAGHMLGDVAALSLAVIAGWLSAKPASASRTYGYHRSEILAALANSVLMVLISIFVFIEAIGRLTNPPEVHSVPMLIVASLGLCVNIFSMRLLTSSADKSLNARAAYLEVFSDMIASVGVVAAAVIMMTTGWYMADPLLSGTLAIFILWRTWGLLKESIDILMENAPAHVHLDELSKEIGAIPGVVSVHDLHVWTITSGMISMSGHVSIDDTAESSTVLNQIKTLLNNKYEIKHSTIQLETAGSTSCNNVCAI